MSHNVKLVLLTHRCKIPRVLQEMDHPGQIVCPKCDTIYSVGLVVEKIGCNWVPIHETPGYRRSHLFGCSKCEHIFDYSGEDRTPERRCSGGIFYYEEELLKKREK